jgi:RNA polymerase sigma factor (sigma-70 family)
MRSSFPAAEQAIPTPGTLRGALLALRLRDLRHASASHSRTPRTSSGRSRPRVQRLSELRSDEAKPWLAPRRLSIDRLRLIARDTPSDAELDEREVDNVLGQLDEAMAVRAALDKVGDPCREILDRFFCRDESYRTIGDMLEIPSGTIASRISRCLEKVRSELDGRSRASRPS